MSGQIMMFPDSVEEFMESYKMVDTEHIYSNGTEYVPIFRMKQWFEHEVKHGRWMKGEKMTHKIKILEPYADAVADGRKTFEVRYNDRGYNAGDLVRFTVIDKHDIPLVIHPLNNKTYRITYVHSGMGMRDEWVVFGMREER